jgi:type VI secretion system secreted protein Hcp
MKRKVLWVAVAVALIALPAVVGLIVFDDGSSSSARRAAALVPAGGTTSYQLQLIGAPPVTPVTDGKEAIAVEDFAWGSENVTTIGSATGGAGAGKIKFNEFTIKKSVDKASPALFRNEAAGAHYQTAILTIRRAGETKPYLTYTMKTVFTTKVDYSGSSGEPVVEEVTFVFGSVTVEVSEDGVVKQAGWDQVLNKSVP